MSSLRSPDFLFWSAHIPGEYRTGKDVK